MKWKETHTAVSTDPTANPRSWDVDVEIEQPFWNWLISRIVHKLDLITYRTPGFKKVWRYGEVELDKIAERLHARRCNDDCGKGYKRLPDDPPGRFEMTEDRAFTVCTRMPLAARWDCWVYHITHRNAKMDYKDGRVGH